MNKARLEWVISGLNQYALTKAEDQFLKTALGDFDKNHALTEQQEDRPVRDPRGWSGFGAGARFDLCCVGAPASALRYDRHLVPACSSEVGAPAR